ncbi:MAG: PepSY domain-containing protein [Lachnospiraceae bacterium]|nr:PepSY domain-containing protein [Lachnospiraceae bacterium]
MKARAFLIAFICIITAMSAGCGTRDEESDTDIRPSGEAVGNNAAEATEPPVVPTETQVQQNKYSGLSMDEVTEIARQNAGVAEDQVQNLRVLLESEGEGRQYEVSFRTADREYRYRIEASDGTILEKSVDAISTAENTQGQEEAGNTAPTATAVPETTTEPAAAVSPSAPSGTSGGGVVGTGGTSGSTGVASGSGTVSVPSDPTAAAGTQPPAGLTQDEAVGIAAKDAGVAVSELRRLQVKLDYEDGIQVYEIEFEVGSTEYEYEIAVSDGTIRKRDMEQIGGTQSGISGTGTSGSGAVGTGGTSGSTGAASGSGTVSTPSDPTAATGAQPSAGLTQDEAVGIAAKDAGVAVSELRRLQVKLDYEDGIPVYEIEFEAGSAEYEYKIAVSNGMILEREIDDDFYCGDHHHHHH